MGSAHGAVPLHGGAGDAGAGTARTVDGACEGIIAFGPAGSNGFGYDPVFYFPEQGATMAQLDPEVKNRISHRGRAAQAAVGVLADDVGGSELGRIGLRRLRDALIILNHLRLPGSPAN